MVAEGERTVILLFEHGEVCYPEERMHGGIDQVEALGGFRTDAAEGSADDLHFVRTEKDRIARFCARCLLQLLHESFREEFKKRRVRTFRFEEDVCESFRFELLRKFRPAIDLAPRKLGTAGDSERPDGSLCLQRIFKDFKS